MSVAARRPASAPVEGEERIRPITEREFTLFQGLIHRDAGIYLAPAKKALLVGRLSKLLRALGLGSFGAYYNRIVEGDRDEHVRMLDCISTNETHFFREPRQFEFLEQRVIPAWKERGAPRIIRVWSAGCSTGEEPYSLAMLLLRHFPPGSGRQIEITATDISTRALALAEEATWSLDKADEVPFEYRKAFMLRGTGSKEGQMRAAPEIRALVRFDRLNLNAERYSIRGPFDLIFCRNVLIYFQMQTKLKVIHRLLDLLAPEGLLFLGHAESLNAVTDRVRNVVPTVYANARPEPAVPALVAAGGRPA